MAILLFVHLTRHSSTASEQLSCIARHQKAAGKGSVSRPVICIPDPTIKPYHLFKIE
jgi:hypothetical protein